MTDYFVDPASGNDGNAGTSTGAAWATFQKAADTAVAGDEVFLMNTATETTATPIDFDINAGTRTSQIKFTAANSSGVKLTTGHYTIQASASITGLIAPTSASPNCVFEGIDFDGNSNVTGAIISAGNSGEAAAWHIKRCKIHGATGAGINARGGINLVTFCEIFDNGGRGVQPASAAGSRCPSMLIMGCTIRDNDGAGIGGFAGQPQFSAIYNRIYGNGGGGIIGITGGVNAVARLVLIGNTIFNNTGAGIDVSDLQDHMNIFNNIIRSNSTFGLVIGDTVAAFAGFIDFNCYSNNTSGASDETTLSGDNNILTDPKFVSETGGSEDFRLDPDSPCHLTGIGGSSMGQGPINDQAGGGGSASILGYNGLRGGLQ